MKVVHIPKNTKSLVFDIDLTLYDNMEYYKSQSTLLIERLGRHFGISAAEAKEKVRAVRDEFARSNGGRKLSMGNIFLQLGISITTSVRWREELFEPEKYLTPDGELHAAFGRLSKSFSIAAVTNNPTSIGRRTLAALGVIELFNPVVGLDVSGESKPTMIPIEMVAEEHGVLPDAVISIGDRMAVDIELPVQNGMGGILVEQVADVYQLPALLERD